MELRHWYVVPTHYFNKNPLNFLQPLSVYRLFAERILAIRKDHPLRELFGRNIPGFWNVLIYTPSETLPHHPYLMHNTSIRSSYLLMYRT